MEIAVNVLKNQDEMWEVFLGAFKVHDRGRKLRSWCQARVLGARAKPMGHRGNTISNLLRTKNVASGGVFGWLHS